MTGPENLQRGGEADLDAALAETFPASDPVAVASPTRAGSPGSPTQGAVLLDPGGGHHIPIGALDVRYKASSEMTNYAAGVYELTLAARSPGAGLHFHRELTEMFYIVSGKLSLTIDGREMSAVPGTFAFVPPGVAHAFANTSDAPVRFLLIFTPALAREGFFEGLAELHANGRMGDHDAMGNLMKRFDQQPVHGVAGWTELTPTQGSNG